MAMTLDELRKLRDNKKLDIQRREAEGKEIHVIVGMGTCGIAAGAKATLDSFINALDTYNIADKVIVRQAGCMGLCHSEPTVEINSPGMPNVIYGHVDATAAKDIVVKHIVGRQLLEKNILNKPAADILK